MWPDNVALLLSPFECFTSIGIPKTDTGSIMFRQRLSGDCLDLIYQMSIQNGDKKIHKVAQKCISNHIEDTATFWHWSLQLRGDWSEHEQTCQISWDEPRSLKQR